MPVEDYTVWAVWAIPLSHIFGQRGSCDGGRNSDPTLCLRSQDVFRHPFKVVIPDSEWGRFPSMSICTSSWKTPSLCELDAPATPTRILLSFTTRFLFNDYNYMVAEFLLSPTESTPSSRPSVSSIVDDTTHNGFLLIYERHTLGYSCSPEVVMSPTRSGRVLAPYSIYSKEIESYRRYRIAFSMHEFLEGRDGLINVIDDEHIMGRSGHFPINSAIGERYRVDVEEYSGAIWYRSDTELFLHHTD